MGSIDDPKTWNDFSNPDEEFAKLIAEGAPRRFPPVNLDDIPGLRAAWKAGIAESMATTLEAAKDAVSVERISIPLRDGATSSSLIFKPKRAPEGGAPLVVLIHGGGFLFGTPEMEAPGCIAAVETYGCVCVSLEYRLAPEAKFPVAIEDCWDALQWLAKNAASLGADPSKGFVLGGTSSGGQLTGTLTHLARDTNLSPPLTGAYFNVTSIAMPEAIPAKYKAWYSELAESDESDEKLGLTTKSQQMFWEAVRPDPKSDLYNPLNWKSGHAGLPRTYFQVCGADLQRNDSLIYERVLRTEYGIETKVDMYPGLPHVFWFLYPQHSACERFSADRNRGLGWLLRR